MVKPEQALRCGSLDVRSELRGTTHLVFVVGELDESGCPKLESQLARIEASDAERIVVDLSDVEFIDSAGIALLVAAQRRSEQDSARLRFIPSDSANVQRLLQLCGLEEYLPLVEDVPLAEDGDG